jgi:hypothetical protein
MSCLTRGALRDRFPDVATVINARSAPQVDFRRVVGFDDPAQHLFGGFHRPLGGEQPQSSHRRVEQHDLQRVGDRDLQQGVDESLGRQIDEFSEDPLAPCVLLRAPSRFVLMMLRQPCRSERGEGSDGRAGESRNCR